ncbi:MAG: fluoride efflux transporter CrcB [Thermoplasmatota archaeon]
MDARQAAAVALGGALGALARYALGHWATGPARDGALPFPWMTLAINLVGSFALGWLLLGGAGDDWSAAAKAGFATGFLGAFTTLSTFSVETTSLWQAGQRAAAAGYVAATTIGGPLVAWLGGRLGSAL